MKELPRRLRALRDGLWLGLFFGILPAHAQAQELLVVEASEQDAPAADKLASLLEQPMRRVRAAGTGASALCPEPSVAYGLLLDAAHHVVQLLRCRDQTLLTRVIAADANPSAPYVSAYVATELLALGADIGERTARAAERRPEPSVRVRVRLRLRAAAELLVAAGVYSGSGRPNLSVGLDVQASPGAPRVLAELGVAPLASGERSYAEGRLQLTRSDVSGRVGVEFPFGALQVAAFGQLACAFTAANFQGESRAPEVRWAGGVGVAVSVGLNAWLSVVGELTGSAALSRSEYQFMGRRLLRDPAQLVQLGAGLVATPAL